jgi:hypothetical protein
MIAALGRKRLSDFGLLSGFNIDQGATVLFFRSFWGDVMERYESSGLGAGQQGWKCMPSAMSASASLREIR